jgi:hypothetical protein
MKALIRATLLSESLSEEGRQNLQAMMAGLVCTVFSSLLHELILKSSNVVS